MKTFLRSLLVALASMAAIVTVSIGACGNDAAGRAASAAPPPLPSAEDDARSREQA